MRCSRNADFASGQSTKRRRRRAFTLVELSVVLAILSIVTVGAYRLFGRLNEAARHTVKHDLAVQEIYRLSQSFRDHVRQARDVQVAEDGRSIRLITAVGIANYSLSRKGVAYSFAPQTNTNSPSRQDLFICPIDDSLRCRADRESRLVILPVMAGLSSADTQVSDFRSRPIELIEKFSESPK